MQLSTSSIWVAQDLPITIRTERKFLFGLRRLMLSWGWQTFEIRVDEYTRALTVDGQPICHVHAHDQQFDVRFQGQWQARLQDDALNQLFLTCKQMMQNRKICKGAGNSSS